MKTFDVAVVIPAYNPADPVLKLAERLTASVQAVVIVNDGSDSNSQECFAILRRIPGVVVIDHAINMGKGAALKSGINYVLCHRPNSIGIVTADADGQHAVQDILNIAGLLEASPDSLILGVRDLNRKIPLRSFLGNTLTRAAVRAIVGHKLKDTQTGLRGIPRNLALQILSIPSNGYEFELDVLIACKHFGVTIREQSVQTIYESGNPTSHFNPLKDSMRIYFVLLRFAMVSLITAALDNAVFLAAFYLSGNIWKSQAAGRVAAVGFNYLGARRAVFLSRESHSHTLSKYLLLVIANALISYQIIYMLIARFALSVPWAKLITESALFLANFTIQRDFVFTKRSSPSTQATDWDHYYQSVPFTAKLTRRYTRRILIDLIQRFSKRCPAIIELGGANSCFVDAVLKNVEPPAYRVVDTNQYGLDLLKSRFPDSPNISATRLNVLDIKGGTLPPAELVFSIGLIEHFDPAGTSAAIASHFELLQPGGCAIISFPTPTWLYRSARAVCEKLGLWKFPDERPLSRDEVIATANKYGDVLFEKILWPLVFTQRIMVIRKEAK